MSTRARIATICQSGNFHPTVVENNAEILNRLNLALKQNPDLVCLPESFSAASVSKETVADLAETIPGPTIDAFAKRAREHHCYILCPVFTYREDRFWNSVVVIDRSGSILGIYDKLHPVTSTSDYTQFEHGITPGSQVPVFDLDFGRIGIQICFDILFPDSWAELARKGASMVVWSSAYNGGYPLQVYAGLHHYYIVSSVCTEKSRIIDPCGTILAETDYQSNIIVRDINLDYAVCHYDFNYSIPDRILAAYPGQVEIRTHWDAGQFLIEPIDPGLTISRMQSELGFITIQEYATRHQKGYAAIREGKLPTPQQAAHGNRSAYQKQS
jgi:beta-ureidopropionase